MNNLLTGALVLLLIALGWSLWRFIALRHAVNTYTRAIQRLDKQSLKYPQTNTKKNQGRCQCQ